MYPLQRLLVIALVCTATGTNAANDTSPPSLPFKRLVVFGDSWSDNGRVYALTKGIYPASPPYHQRLSNGHVWNEYLAASEGWVLENYAFAGATTDSHVINDPVGPNNIVVPGLAEQITELFFPTLTSTTRLAGLNETTLYVVWPNGNDFGKDHTASPFLVAERVISSVDLIRTRVPSAKHFVLFHLSDISQMPYVTSMDEQSIPGHPGAAEVLGKALLVVSAFFDMFLDELAKNYEHNHPGVVLSIFPADKLLKYLHTDAGMALAGIKETKEPCIKYHFENGTTIFTNICDNPNDYLYWDWYHPTTVIHAILAVAVRKFLENQYLG